MFVLIRLKGFIISIIGWGYIHLYSLMNSIRFIGQSIFYEVKFLLIIFLIIFNYFLIILFNHFK